MLIADSFAWINGKMGGDLERIREVGRYFVEVWRAAGVPMNKVEIVWHKDLFDDPKYWKKVVLIAKNHTSQETKRRSQKEILQPLASTLPCGAQISSNWE